MILSQVSGPGNNFQRRLDPKYISLRCCPQSCHKDGHVFFALQSGIAHLSDIYLCSKSDIRVINPQSTPRSDIWDDGHPNLWGWRPLGFNPKYRTTGTFENHSGFQKITWRTSELSFCKLFLGRHTMFLFLYPDVMLGDF